MNRSIKMGLVLVWLAIAHSAAYALDFNVIGRNLEGEIVSLKNEIKGQAAVINFWWVNCKPCKNEMPELLDMAADNEKVKFIFVHAYDDPQTGDIYTRPPIKRFIDTYAPRARHIILAGTRAQHDAGVEKLPTTFLISSQGGVEKKFTGYNDKNMMAIRRWLNRQK